MGINFIDMFCYSCSICNSRDIFWAVMWLSSEYDPVATLEILSHAEF